MPAGHEPISCEPPIHRHNARHRPRWAIVVVHRAEASADVVSPDWRIDLADRFPPLLTTLVEARQQQHLQGLYYRSPASRTAAWPGRSPVRSISLSPPTVAPPTVRWRNADKKLLERRLTSHLQLCQPLSVIKVKRRLYPSLFWPPCWAILLLGFAVPVTLRRSAHRPIKRPQPARSTSTSQ